MKSTTIDTVITAKAAERRLDGVAFQANQPLHRLVDHDGRENEQEPGLDQRR